MCPASLCSLWLLIIHLHFVIYYLYSICFKKNLKSFAKKGKAPERRMNIQNLTKYLLKGNETEKMRNN